MFLKKTYRYIIYVSLAFLLYKLAGSNYLHLPVIYSWQKLTISIGLLFAANLLSAYIWFRMLHLSGAHIRYDHALGSLGLNVFAKYIPGMIWIVIGNASYIYEKFDVPKARLLLASVYFQILTVWCALLLGAVGLGGMAAVKADVLYIITIVITVLGAGGLLFAKTLNKFINTLLKAVKRPPMDLSFSTVYLKTIPFYFFINAVWGLAFYFYASSVCQQPISLKSALGFNLGIAYGILSVFTPGGIGVREGITAKFLMDLGVDAPTAISISASSRIWFLIGEALFFLQGLIAYYITRHKDQAG